MAREDLITAFRLQAGGCKLFGSPLYQHLCERALEDLERDGALGRLLGDFPGDAVRDWLPLRLLGAVHERVLAGEAPDLARHYPSAGGAPDWATLYPAFLSVLEAQAEALRPALARFPQTNEVRRCAALLPGFLRASAEAPGPLHLREIGCSAGLNLRFDRYRYAVGDWRFGPEDAPLTLDTEWSGAPPPPVRPLEVATRAGCDLDPRSIASDDDVRWLEAYVWPDQPERRARLRAAVEVARRVPARVERARASGWLPRELAGLGPGCTVVYHSAVWIYVPLEERGEIAALLAERGAQARPGRALAWLRLEDHDTPGTLQLHLTLWPGGRERHLARCHPHGTRVRWLGDGD